MPRLITLYPGVHLDLVGIYPPAEIKALESDSIHVTGHVQDITPFMEEAAVVLAPVRIGGGMRMKVLHSMAMNKPVVTTSRGADGLCMWGTPPLKIADDAEGFAQATASLLSDVRARRELGTAARAFVAEYLSPQAYVNRLESTYKQVRAQKEQPERSLYGS